MRCPLLLFSVPAVISVHFIIHLRSAKFFLCNYSWCRRLVQIMVAQTAPAVRVAIGEEAGLAPGSVTTGQMVAGLKRLGFDYVFDTGMWQSKGDIKGTHISSCFWWAGTSCLMSDL